MRVLSRVTFLVWICSQTTGTPHTARKRALEIPDEAFGVVKGVELILDKAVREGDRVLVLTANETTGALKSICLKALSLLPVTVMLASDLKNSFELSDDFNVVRRFKRVCERVSINYLVFFIDIVSESSLRGSLQRLIGHYCWNNRGRLVLLRTDRSTNFGAARRDLRLLWSNYILNAASVILSDRYSPRVLTYNGFLEEQTGTGWLEGGELFPDKLQDLHGHGVRTSIFPFHDKVVRSGADTFAGPDAWEVETVVSAMGGRTVFLLPRRWEEEFVGMSEELTTGRAHVGANGAQLGTTPSTDVEVEAGAPRRFSSVCPAVPAAGDAPAALHLLRPFSPPVWAAVAAAAAAAAACRLLLLAAASPPPDVQGWALLVAECALDAVRGLLCGALPARHGAAGLGQRVLQLTLAALCLLVCGAFQGSLTGHLALPAQLPDIDTLRQLRLSGLRVVFFPGTADAYRHLDPDDPLFGLADRLVELEHYGPVMERVIRDKVAAMSTAAIGHYLAALPEYTRSDGRPLVHIMRECVLSAVPVVHRMTPGCPFLERWNTLLGRVAQSGLRSRWENAVSLRRRPTHSAAPSGATVLRVDHLTGAFLTLAVGSTIAVLVFSIEVIVHRLQHASAR